MSGLIVIHPALAIPEAELTFRTSRSGGPGGQHVNTTDSKVELYFDVRGTACLPEPTRARLLEALAPRLDGQGVLRLVCQSSRSQHANKRMVVSRFQEVLAAALKPQRKRVATRPGRAARARRLDLKRQRSSVKQSRQRPNLE